LYIVESDIKHHKRNTPQQKK